MSKAATAKPTPKPIGLQLHEHLQIHRGCSVETCAENQRLREAQRKIDERETAKR